MVKLQTQKQLNKARKTYKAIEDRIYPDELHMDLDVFIAKERNRPNFIATAVIYEYKMFSEMATVFDIDKIDWDAWRLSVEYLMLEFRANAATNHRLFPTPTDASLYLRLAYGQWFLGQDQNAAKTAQICLKLLPDTAARFLKPKAPAKALGSIGFFLNHLGVGIPSHTAFEFDSVSLLTQEGLAQAMDMRAYYSNAAYKGGAVLQAPVGDLIPLEIIFLNICLPSELRDKDFSEMAQCMANTKYPEDDLFVELDTKLTIAGY